jgi:DNA-binding transcriptional regulator YdaS (Cro superfamily)
VSATTVKLLQAASEIVGGDEALANRLGISERLLSRFMADRRELPDPLLLRAVDIVAAERQSCLALTGELAPQSSQESRRER